MTDEQRTAIAGYRRSGCGYKKISQLTGLCESTVKTYCRRNGLPELMSVFKQVADIQTADMLHLPVPKAITVVLSQVGNIGGEPYWSWLTVEWSGAPAL